MKKLFWDSNIYRFIVEKDEEDKVLQFIKRSKLNIVISTSIMMEALQISDVMIREKNLNFLSSQQKDMLIQCCFSAKSLTIFIQNYSRKSKKSRKINDPKMNYPFKRIHDKYKGVLRPRI